MEKAWQSLFVQFSVDSPFSQFRGNFTYCIQQYSYAYLYSVRLYNTQSTMYCKPYCTRTSTVRLQYLYTVLVRTCTVYTRTSTGIFEYEYCTSIILYSRSIPYLYSTSTVPVMKIITITTMGFNDFLQSKIVHRVEIFVQALRWIYFCLVRRFYRFISSILRPEIQ